MLRTGGETKMLRRTLLAMAATLAFGVPGAVMAQNYPNKPISIIVPFSAGGSVDRLTRGLANYLSMEIGQPVVVENRAGGSALVGHTSFLRTPADGYTFLMSTAHPYMATNILLLDATFTLDDFDFINVLWADQTAIYVNNDKPYKTMRDLIEAMKANPGTLSLSTLNGSAGHVAMLALAEALNLPGDVVRIVTYEGGGESKAAAAGGIVDFTSTQVEGIETIKDFVTGIGVFESERLASDPNMPTMNEVLAEYGTSVPNITGSMRTFVAHAGLKVQHPDRYEFISAALERTLERPDFREWLQAQNIPAIWRGPEVSRSMLYENFEVVKEYVDLFKE